MNIKTTNLKNMIAVLFFTCIISTFSYAQNVGINETGNAPDPSAMLDVDATNKGLLVPRVALTGTTDATTIATPATSLLVYNTANAGGVSPGYYYNSGTTVAPVWTPFSTPSKFTVPFSSLRAAGMVNTSQNPIAVGSSSPNYDLGNPASGPISLWYPAFSIFTAYSDCTFNGLTGWYFYPSSVTTTFWLYRYRQPTPNSAPVQGVLLGTVTVNTNSSQFSQVNIFPGANTDLIKGDMLLLFGQNQTSNAGSYVFTGSLEIINQ